MPVLANAPSNLSRSARKRAIAGNFKVVASSSGTQVPSPATSPSASGKSVSTSVSQASSSMAAATSPVQSPTAATPVSSSAAPNTSSEVQTPPADAAGTAVAREPTSETPANTQKQKKTWVPRRTGRPPPQNYWQPGPGVTVVLANPFSCIEARNGMYRVQQMDPGFNDAASTNGCGQSFNYFLPFRQNFGPILSDVSNCQANNSNSVHQNSEPKRPCFSYNHGHCVYGPKCRGSHEKDGKSERDKNQKNVCVFFLLDRCKYGSACFYLHDASALPHDWWNDPVLVAEAKAFFDRTILDPPNVAHQIREHLRLFKEQLDRKNSAVVSQENTPSRSTSLDSTECSIPEETTHYEQSEKLDSDTASKEALPSNALHDVPKCNGVPEECSTSDQNERPELSAPFISLLSFRDKTERESKRECLETVSEHISLVQARDTEDALNLMSSTHLSGIFVADPSISDPERTVLREKLGQYTKDGGTVVLGGSFANDFPLAKFREFFEETWGHSWEVGSFLLSHFKTSSLNELVNNCSQLPPNYQMQALCVRGISPTDMVYGVNQSDQSEQLQAPVVFAKVGKGRLGFVGDVYWEKSTTTVILAMFGLIPAAQPTLPAEQQASPCSEPPPSPRTEATSPFPESSLAVQEPSPLPSAQPSSLDGPSLAETSSPSTEVATMQVEQSELEPSPKPLSDQTEASSQLAPSSSPQRLPLSSLQEEPSQLESSFTPAEANDNTHTK